VSQTRQRRAELVEARRSSPSRQQARVPAGRRGGDRRHPLGGEADHVIGPASLGTRTRETLAAERLAADDRADLVAVDVEVARAGTPFDEAAGGIDAAVQAEREAIAGGVDVL